MSNQRNPLNFKIEKLALVKATLLYSRVNWSQFLINNINHSCRCFALRRLSQSATAVCHARTSAAHVWPNSYTSNGKIIFRYTETKSFVHSSPVLSNFELVEYAKMSLYLFNHLEDKLTFQRIKNLRRPDQSDLP